MRHFLSRNGSLAAILVALFVGSCTSTQSPAPVPVAPPPPDPNVPTLSTASGPPECANPINAFQRVIAADVGTGSLDPNVFPRIATDLGPVRAVCASGDAAGANRELQATKRKYGYR